MNLSDDDEAPVVEKESGKRRIGEVEPAKQPIGSYLKFPVAVDSFGAINVLSADKFGALRGLDESQPNVYRREQNKEESSTGSFTPSVYIPQAGGKRTHQAGAGVTPSANDSNWSKYITDNLDNDGLSKATQDPSSHSSVPVSCTLHERTSTSSGAGLPPKRFCPPPNLHHSANETHGEPEISQNELADFTRIAEQNDSEQEATARSLPTVQSRFSIDPTRVARIPTPTVRFNIDGAVLAPNSSHSSKTEAGATVDKLPLMIPESSDNARHYGESSDPSPALVRFNYKFASAGLEASLLQRMEGRQKEQDDQLQGADQRCGHVISPEDLIWGSVKHYCGMVLDRETRVLLGTAILFMPPEQGSPAHPKSAWVTCVKVVEGRTEVLIKNSKGGIHVAQLILTSTALGLALFSVHVWQGTFALAFLSRVTGTASLPHRLFVDVGRSDRVYVIGYEEPWVSESGAIADVRIRPGRIIDTGLHSIVEIDFTTGRLGGSITSPAGFRGGLVVRADGLLAGVVTGEILASHRTNIDFSPAFNVYSLLAEL